MLALPAAGETASRGPARYKQCACCAGNAGRWAQHYNRDTGYGVCTPCYDLMLSGTWGRDLQRMSLRERLDYLANLYGRPGVNHGGGIA